MRLGTGLSLTLPRGSGQSTEAWLAANAAVWLDPSDVLSMRQDRSGAPPGTVNGDNYVLQSEDLDSASWGSSTGAANVAGVLLSDGTTGTVTKVTKTDASAYVGPVQIVGPIANGTRVRITFEVKPVVAGAAFVVYNLDVGNLARFNLTNGTVVSTIGSPWNGEATITSLDNGWYYCNIEYTIQVNNRIAAQFCAKINSIPEPDEVYVTRVRFSLEEEDDGSPQYYTKTTTSPIIKAAVGDPVGSMLNKGTLGGWFIAGADASRPVVASLPASGLRNTLKNTNNLTLSAVWQNVTGTTTRTAITDPDGGLEAFRLTTGAVDGGIYQSIPFGTLRLSVKVKAGSSSTFRLANTTVGNGSYIDFDLSAGTVGLPVVVGDGRATFSDAAITDVGGGWYLCEVTSTSLQDGNSILTVVGVSGSTMDFFEPQCERGTAKTTYQKVSSNTLVEEDGVTNVYVPYFDQVDDGLYSESSLDFSVTDKVSISAAAWCRNANKGIITELTASTETATGAFYLGWYEDATTEWSSAARGDAAYAAGQMASDGTGLSRSGAVLTATHDIAGDLSTIRRNGVAKTSGTGDKGTGNFANDVLFVGRRGNSTLPFNGYLYGLAIFPTVLSASDIARVEAYMAAKSGVTL